MSYLVVENFSAGLDTRRHPLTARPGTLQTLKNAHVSRGGEIEKRKKFATFASLTGSTFGMESTSETIYVFGSDASVTTPTGVTYQRCQHPDGFAMTDVVFSTLYGGQPFVIAKFSNGSTYPFLNGVIVSDFVNGITQASMTNLAGVATHMASTVGDGYTATASGNVITLSGPASVDYNLTVTADAPITATLATSTAYVAPVLETIATGSFSITGGSDQPASAWRTGRYMAYGNGNSIPGIKSIRVGATSTTSDDGIDILNFTGSGGLKWNTASPTDTVGADVNELYWNIANAINNSTSVTKYSAKYVFIGYYHGPDLAGFSISAPAGSGSLMNGKIVQIEFVSDPSGVSSLGEFVDGPIIASPYNTGMFVANFTTLNGGQDNAITSITVDGVEALGKSIPWIGSNTDTMVALANQINTFTSSTEYIASVSNSKVVMSGIAGSGKSLNGHIISITIIGNVVASAITKFDGGADAVPGNSKHYTITLGGTFATGRNITISAAPTLDANNPFYWGSTRVAQSVPVSALTFKSKEHITSSSLLYFSGVNQPTKWGFNGVGAGFINLSNNSGGNEVLTGLALYQGNLAAFARRSVQVWHIDPDPANNVQGQVISNTGAIGASSIVSFGEIDVFYLSDSGIRSLRARDASNAAVVNDVGTPVDNLILTDLAGLTDAQKAACPAIIEPIDGRYWIAIGSKIYVYSYFPNSQVAAWSTYEPGFSVSKFTTKDGRVYARSGNTIYLYGGTTGTEYDNSTVEVILPYLDGGKPAHIKTLNGIDMTCEGYWQVYIGMDPLAVSARDLIATVNQPTFSLGRIMASGIGTHVGVRLVNNTSGYARIANLIAHFELNEAN